jgi:hypothetical protein
MVRQMLESRFPESAIAVMRAAQYDPSARRSLEVLSGAFIWDDECYFEFVAHSRAAGCLLYWQPVLFRSSIIMGKPDGDSRQGWEDLRRVAPEWPGFREERYSESLRAFLEHERAIEP